ncbi:hypothetical protein Plim_2537 [Planctopirus limnophila DSM 3776]|uniref:Uncharacterized protein n=1 Tax=Planctopirus limnophila (strain ATCC 43296 / DSM 3776 / IFAM 1008 / Mu 290) TaxID=521674 RepID=D5SPY7_PLAL2|nr:hypothetical protein [Planctopirus limnophila]ADG68362.1 hypothetical protein Plim_2537 [Planctopirus limnophila DSM 3776]
MFGWFKPWCPVDPHAKAWVEQRLIWLTRQFGKDVFTRRAVILPTDDFFPEMNLQSPDGVKRLFHQVCSYMDVDSERVILKTFKIENPLWLVNQQGKYLPPGAAGLYEQKTGKAKIHIEISDLTQAVDLIGTMAHELSHLRLMGEYRVQGDEYDNELLTDLNALFHGFGLFLANSPRNWESRNSRWPGTSHIRPEYMTPPMYGYALAHLAWLRHETKPEWVSYLRGDSKTNFRYAHHYLLKTGDSSMKP